MKTLIHTLLFLFITALALHASDLWSTDYQKTLDQAAKEDKMVLLDFTGSNWCHWCELLQKEVFSKSEFKDYAAKHLLLVEIDFPQGKEQPKNVKQQNSELQAKYHVEGFPTLILLSPKGKMLKQNSGYLPGGPEGFIKWVKGS